MMSIIKRSQLGVFSIGHNLLLPWIQTSQKPKIVFNWSKRIIISSYIVLQKKGGFAPFLKHFLDMLTLRNTKYSWYYGEKQKMSKGNLCWTKNQLSRNEMWCADSNFN